MEEVLEVITIGELTDYLGDTPVPSNASTLVDLGNRLVIDAWSDPVQPPAPAWVQTLTLEVVARAIRNPKGLASWTRSVDDASRTERLPETASRAGLFLTPEERARLAGSRRRRRSRYGTVQTRLGY